MIKKSSEAWYKDYPFRIIDPDGWDRRNFDASWAEEITEDEFFLRADMSTIDGRKEVGE